MLLAGSGSASRMSGIRLPPLQRLPLQPADDDASNPPSPTAEDSSTEDGLTLATTGILSGALRKQPYRLPMQYCVVPIHHEPTKGEQPP